MNFAKALVPFFSYPMAVTYDFSILFMFAKIRTSIRIREWNADMSKYKSRLFEDQPKLQSLQVCKVRVTSVSELELAEWIEHNVATLFYWYESSMICFFSEKIIWHEIWQTFHNMINFKINLILLFYTNIHFILDIIFKLILPQKSLFSKDVP